MEGRRLGVTLGHPDSGLSLVLGGPWGTPSTARLTAAVLRELTDAGQLADEAASLLEPGPWQVLSDKWHPNAALVMAASLLPDPEDPLGRRVSRALGEVERDLQAAQPDWDFQSLISVEGSVVALRITRRDRAAPRLIRKCLSDSAHGPDELGNTRTTFAPADLPEQPGPPDGDSSLALHVAVKDEHYTYGVKPELGEWAYVLEAQAVLYGPGWYPFHEHMTRREKDPTAPLNDPEVPTGRTVPARVRISPAAEHRSWGNEYIQLIPVDHRVEARLYLYVGQDSGRSLVRTVTLEIDLRAKRVRLPTQMPAALRYQAEVKGRRILDLLLAARRELRRGVSEPRAVLGPRKRGAPPSADT